MKKSFYFLLLFFLIGCSYSKENSVNTDDGKQPAGGIAALKKVSTNISGQPASKETVLSDDADSVLLQTYPETIKETKGRLRKILKYHSELQTEFPQQPDISYELDNEKSSANGHIDFSSEAGQDEYFLFYSYFLGIKNGGEKYQAKRVTLTNIYQDIYLLYLKLLGGGASYRHVYFRICAYVEYSISQGTDVDSYERTYNISNQKRLYINSLKQRIIDELNTTMEVPDKTKPKLKKELFKTVNQIDGLITNFYY